MRDFSNPNPVRQKIAQAPDVIYISLLYIYEKNIIIPYLRYYLDWGYFYFKNKVDSTDKIAKENATEYLYHEQETHGPYRSFENPVQINKHLSKAMYIITLIKRRKTPDLLVENGMVLIYKT